MVWLSVAALLVAHICMVQCGTVQLYGLCTETSECVPDVGLSCVHFYTTCANGQFACPDSKVWDENRCQPVLYAGSTCTATRTRFKITDATCVDGIVKCNDGFTQVDGWCQSGTIGLGAECATSSDCYNEDAEGRMNTATSRKVCACETNYKIVNSKCQKAQIGGHCTNVDECESDTKMVCGIDNTCLCISTRVPYDGECKEAGSKPVNESCSEGGSDGCKLGHSCKRCPGESSTRCLRKASSDSASIAGVNEACSSTSDCIAQVGLTCVFPYTTCTQGVCQCSGANSWSLNMCKPELIIDSVCPATGTLPLHSTCVAGKVKCDAGYSAVGTKLCLPGTKALGVACVSSDDCYVINAECGLHSGASSRTCLCATNYKNMNNVCRKGLSGLSPVIVNMLPAIGLAVVLAQKTLV